MQEFWTRKHSICLRKLVNLIHRYKSSKIKLNKRLISLDSVILTSKDTNKKSIPGNSNLNIILSKQSAKKFKLVLIIWSWQRVSWLSIKLDYKLSKKLYKFRKTCLQRKETKEMIYWKSLKQCNWTNWQSNNRIKNYGPKLSLYQMNLVKWNQILKF